MPEHTENQPASRAAARAEMCRIIMESREEDDMVLCYTCQSPKDPENVGAGVYRSSSFRGLIQLFSCYKEVIHKILQETLDNPSKIAEDISDLRALISKLEGDFK